MRTRQLLPLVIIVLSLLVSPLAGSQPPGDEEQPVTGTITESGFCTNPSENPSGAIWEDIKPLSDLHGDIQVLTVELTLRWSDDEGSSSDPDSFVVSAVDELGNQISDSGSTGDLSALLEMEELNSTWTLKVECTDAGSTPLGPLGRIRQTDPGNSWSLTFEYTYVPDDGGGGPGIPPHIAELLEHPVFKFHVALMVASTSMFLIVGLLAFTYLVTRSRWAEDPSTLKRWLSRPRLHRSLAPHVWIAFVIAAIPIGIWVAGKAYGWENSWTSFPVVWRPGFWDITNADHVAFLAIVLWAIPMWLNRGDIWSRRPHERFWIKREWFEGRIKKASLPLLSDREVAIIYFLLGVMIFMLFMVQPHG
jgi:hypothetical protein